MLIFATISHVGRKPDRTRSISEIHHQVVNSRWYIENKPINLIETIDTNEDLQLDFFVYLKTIRYSDVSIKNESSMFLYYSNNVSTWARIEIP